MIRIPRLGNIPIIPLTARFDRGDKVKRLKFLSDSDPRLVPMVIVDGEDACDEEAKETLFGNVTTEAFRGLDWGKRILTWRPDSGEFFEAQMAFMLANCVNGWDGIVLAKPETVDAVMNAVHIIRFHARQKRLGWNYTPHVHVLIEGPKAKRLGYEMATCAPEVVSLAFAWGDYSAERGLAASDPDVIANDVLWDHIRSDIVDAANAAGVIPLDSIYPPYWGEDDPQRVEKEAALLANKHRTALIGMKGSLTIHRSHDFVAHCFVKSDEKIVIARQVANDFLGGGGAAKGEGGRQVMQDVATIRGHVNGTLVPAAILGKVDQAWLDRVLAKLDARS